MNLVRGLREDVAEGYVPTATYRVQWREGFGFKQAAELIPYLETLGISHLYVPPIFRAGSLHGYDVVDPHELNEALGGAEAFDALARALRERRMGLLVDFVPNHMGISAGTNRYFDDVLEDGQLSIFADYFDIEWDPPKETMRGKVLLPILAESYGEALEQRKVRPHQQGGTIGLAYEQHHLPVALTTLASLLEEAAGELGSGPEGLGKDLVRIATHLRQLSTWPCSSAAERDARHRQKEATKRSLGELLAREPNVAAAFEALFARMVERTSGEWDALLREQHYRLSSWRVALEATNYRRFFDVNELAAIRVEEPRVFEMVHEKILSLVHAGLVAGLRIDHLDGLYDPRAYLDSLGSALGRASGRSSFYVVVEKILEPGETLPTAFRCAGTTGYDFARLATGVLIDPDADATFARLYRLTTGDRRDFEDAARECKRFILSYILASEVAMLTRALERIADSEPRSRDLSRKSLEAAIVGIMESMPVYRTYIEPGSEEDAEGVLHLERAVADAASRYPGVGRMVFAFVRDVLLRPSDEARARFAMKFQQTTGPAMAKAVEDTAFYGYPKFLGACEVGTTPAQIGVHPDSFHQACAQRLRHWPLSLNTTSTHDTKRSEDVRARLAVLSEAPAAWAAAVKRWSRIGRAKRESSDVPTKGDEYYFFQTVIGLTPFSATPMAVRCLSERVVDHMVKAAKEAKRSTSWIHPDPAYEAALASYARAMLDDDAFLDDLCAFSRSLDPFAASNALAQCVLKCTAPGIPDFYQGAESWLQTLVDPDNRGGVDFHAHASRLDAMDTKPTPADVREWLDRYQDGRIKTHVTRRLLELRRAFPELFLQGDYQALEAGRHVLAFSRTWAETSIVVAVTRLAYQRLGGEATFAIGAKSSRDNIAIPLHLVGAYRNPLTGELISLTSMTPASSVLSEWPVAVLLRNGAQLDHRSA